MPDYKVISAVKTGTYDSQYGEDVDGKKVMFKYAVELEGQSDAVEVSQKPSSPAPKSGDTLTGTIEDGKYGRKFKKESRGGGNWGGGGSASPEASNKQVALAEGARTAQIYFSTLDRLDPDRAKKEFPADIKEMVALQNALAVRHLNFLQKSADDLAGKATLQQVQDVMPGAEDASVNQLDL